MAKTGHSPFSRLVLLGAPGSGKGTQAARLAIELGVPAISTGEMLREAVAAGTELGGRVEAILESGALVDDETMAEVVAARLEQEDAAGGYLLDGYPRTLKQAAALESILAAQGNELDAVLFIDVPEAELVRRALARQRADDNEETIRKRLAVYREKTEPLVGHYREHGLLREIDGYRTIDEVSAAILGVLRSAA